MKQYRIYLLMLFIYPFAISCINRTDKSGKKESSEKFEITKDIQLEFSISKLLQAIEMNWDEFDDFTNSNGFSFEKYDNETDEIIKAYSNGKKKLAKTVNNKKGNSGIAYTFQSQDEYTSLKKQLINSGFKYFDQKGTQETNLSLVSLNYFKKPYQAQLASFQAKGVTDYTILITKY